VRDRSYQEFIEALAVAQSVEGIHTLGADICGQYGFDHFNYGARFPTSFVEPTYVFVSGFPDEWWQRYKEQNYVATDPLVVHCAERIVPIAWHDVRVEISPDERIARRLLGEAREIGLRDGISLPVHARGGESAMLTFSTWMEPPRSTKLIEASLPVLHLLAFHLHEAVRRVAAAQIEAKQPKVILSRREHEALRWAADGKTAWETASIMHVAERTVNWHMDNVRAKLGVATRQQAVARALAWGLLNPGG
jgi:DNA-binding CsgD family transcriptional regulator